MTMHSNSAETAIKTITQLDVGAISVFRYSDDSVMFHLVVGDAIIPEIYPILELMIRISKRIV